MEQKIVSKIHLFLFSSIFIILVTSTSICAWSNGGYSSDPANPDYGTHDWLAEHALELLPINEKHYISKNLNMYLYGTELPDATAGYNDKHNHHLYYYSNGTLQDDPAAIRAQEEYDKVLDYITNNDYGSGAKFAGAMTHYLADLAVFGHVMGAATSWGTESHHSDYEEHVNNYTKTYNSAEFDKHLAFDGELSNISAYKAALDIAHDTTFDVNGSYDAAWMDSNYDWNDPDFKTRTIESLNLAVNTIADVLHSLAWESGYALINESDKPPTAHAAANVTEGDAPLTVTFTGSGSDEDGVIRSYHWDFDDGTTSTEKNPIHTFINSGTYIVKLKITDSGGRTDTDSVVINVRDKPVGDDENDSDGICAIMYFTGAMFCAVVVSGIAFHRH